MLNIISTHTYIHANCVVTGLGPALRIGKQGICLGPQGKRGPEAPSDKVLIKTCIKPLDYIVILFISIILE